MSSGKGDAFLCYQNYLNYPETGLLFERDLLCHILNPCWTLKAFFNNLEGANLGLQRFFFK